MKRREGVLLVLGVVLLANVPVSGALSIVLEQSSSSLVDGFTQSTLTANFDAELSVSVTKTPGYAGDASGWIEFETPNGDDTPMKIWSQVEADPIVDWIHAYAGSGERVVAYTTLYVTPLETLASGYSVAVDGLGELSLEMWPHFSSGAFMPVAFGTIPVTFDFGTLAPGVEGIVVPLPSAVLLGSLGLGWAGWRIRKRQASSEQA